MPVGPKNPAQDVNRTLREVFLIRDFPWRTILLKRAFKIHESFYF